MVIIVMFLPFNLLIVCLFEYMQHLLRTQLLLYTVVKSSIDKYL